MKFEHECQKYRYTKHKNVYKIKKLRSLQIPIEIKRQNGVKHFRIMDERVANYAWVQHEKLQ